MSSAIFTRAIAPATPPAGKVVIYAKVDGRLYWKDETGLESPLRPVGAGTGDLMADGTVPLTANWNAGAFDITAEQFHSSMADGTTPFTVVSTTVVPNLNADRLDGANLIDEDNMASDSDVHVPTQQSVKAYVDSAVIGAITYMGAYDATGNTPDLDTAPTGVSVGDMYTVTVAGTFFTVEVEVGDVLIAEIDSASVEADWTIVQANIIYNAAQIKTLYESNADTNAFTDTEQTKLSQIEALADVTDATNVAAAGAVMESDFDANTILAATTDDTPLPVTVAEQTLIGRITGGNIDDLSVAQVNTLLSLRLNNVAATTDPGVGDDDVDGYSIGSWWLNITDQRLFHCENASTGAAVWLPVYGLAAVRVVAGTTDTILSTDSGKVIVFTNAAAIAVTLPNTFPLNFQFTVIQTTAAGIPTVTRSGADTINGDSAGLAPSTQWKGAYFVQHAANAWICLR